MNARSDRTIVTILGLVLSIALFFTLWGQETSHIAAEFAENAETSALSIESAARQYKHDVEVLHAFFAASSAGVTRTEFRSFVDLHMRSAFSSPGLQSLLWAPVVPDAQRETFVADVRRTGFPDFAISAYPDGDSPPSAAEHTAHVVITYSEPAERTSSSLGLDLSSDPIRRAALEQARDSGQATATAPIGLVIDNAPGFLIFQPLYMLDAPVDSIAARRDAIKSYVVGVFRSDELLHSALAGPDFAAIDFYLFDQADEADRPFYMHMAPSSQPEAGGIIPSRTQLRAGIHYDTTFDVAGRSWRIIARPNPSYIAARRSWAPWVSLILGLAITGWLIRTIAQRHKTAEAIRRSEERYRALIEKSASTFSLVDAGGTIIYNSPNYERGLGYRPGSRVGNSALALIHPDDLAQVSAIFSQVLQTPGMSQSLVFRAQHADGSWHWIESTATNMLSEPAVGAVVVNIRDISDYKLAEAALRESEARLRAIIQSALDGFWLVDQQQRFVDVNDAYCAISGYSREELLALRISDIEVLEQPADIDARIQKILANGKDRFETRHRRKDGSRLDVEVSVRIIESASGVQMACFCRDITDRKRRDSEIRQLNSALEQRVAERTADLSQANAQLQRALRTKDEFLATMSHELRTPLSGILSFSELLLEQIHGPINERQAHAIQSIDSSGRHLLTLINDILDLSKIEAGHIELYPETHAIIDICEASILFVSEVAARKGVAVGFTCSDTLALIDVDAKRAKQMLVNLLGNAVKFTPSGGRVGLDVQIDAAHNLARFSVSDSGIGIAAEDMSRLFQPFTQLDGGLTRRHEGTGLGLALVRRLADILGGSVSVESAGLGAGSRFTVVLPWQQRLTEPPAAMPPPPLPSAGESRPARDVRILLAEDNETTISVLSDFLRSLGYQVRVARNGEEAIAMAVEHQPDLVLMDIQMPVLDGLETTCRLRAMPNFAHTPIVALTALAMPGDRERCLAAGANEYLSKPVSLRGLGELIERLL